MFSRPESDNGVTFLVRRQLPSPHPLIRSMDPAPSDETNTTVDNREEGSDAIESVPDQPKQIYLRTVYPLNPGIPHFVDVPGGW